MTVEIVAVSPHDFDRFKQLVDAAMARSVSAALLTTAWQGTNYRVTGPGVSALGRFHNGEVTVTLTLSFPATMVGRRIVGEIERSLREAGCRGVRSI
jgi:hypothetical protein